MKTKFFSDLAADAFAILPREDPSSAYVAERTNANVCWYGTESHDGVVILHGTDRLAQTGERIVDVLGEEPAVPIVLTGAMRPYALRATDALQNLTEALLAVQLVEPGVYVAMHGTVLRFPGVVKDVQAGTFVPLDAERTTP